MKSARLYGTAHVPCMNRYMHTLMYGGRFPISLSNSIANPQMSLWYNQQVMKFSIRIASDISIYCHLSLLGRFDTKMNEWHLWIHFIALCLASTRKSVLNFWKPSMMFRIPHLTASLTHWNPDKIAAILQTNFANAFSLMKMCEFGLRFHWSLSLMCVCINNIPALFR